MIRILRVWNVNFIVVELQEIARITKGSCGLWAVGVEEFEWFDG